MNRRQMSFRLAAILFSLVLARASQSDLPPVRIILVGDSTMAVNSGYGTGFCDNFAPAVTCLDMAKGGRSTSSYRAEGSWTQVMDELKSPAKFHDTYVLIQFGHNDQPGKPGRSTDLKTEFPANLRRYVDDVKSAGAKPVLVTPLTRRMFVDGKLKYDLEPWADATTSVASAASVPRLDLNSESRAIIQKMGPVEANTLAMEPPPPAFAASANTGTSAPLPPKPANGEAASRFDYTHLGPKGCAFFGRVVAQELVSALPGLKPYLKASE
jgi:lysophospholipase L1-like esterase